MANFKKYSKQNLYVRKANFSILNCPALKKLNRIKYLTYRYDYQTNTFKHEIIYKAFGSLTKIFMFDSFVSYKLNDNNEKYRFSVNLYIPTIMLDYIKFVNKDSILNDLDNLRIEDIDLLVSEIDAFFRMQNKFYREKHYEELIEKYGITEESNYKQRAKALHSYISEYNEVPGFYFWLAILHNVYPFVSYLAKASHTKNKEIEENIFFIYPDRNDPLDRRG